MRTHHNVKRLYQMNFVWISGSLKVWDWPKANMDNATARQKIVNSLSDSVALRNPLGPVSLGQRKWVFIIIQPCSAVPACSAVLFWCVSLYLAGPPSNHVRSISVSLSRLLNEGKARQMMLHALVVALSFKHTPVHTQHSLAPKCDVMCVVYRHCVPSSALHHNSHFQEWRVDRSQSSQ